MSRNLKEHENINLHIKRKLFYTILRGILALIAFIYLITSYVYSLKLEVVEYNFFSWWLTGVVVNGFVLFFGYGLLLIWFTLWEVRW